MKSNENLVKVGLFGVGLDTYWPQFEGLLSRLKGYQNEIKNKITQFGVTVVDAGMVDNPTKALDAAELLKKTDVEIVFLFISTYALSSTVLPVVQRAKVPVIILNLSPEAAINYEAFNKMNDRTKMTGEWLSYCSACPVPEIANVFKRAGIRFHQVTGMLHNDTECWDEIGEWIEAAKVANIMSHNRLVAMGHYYSGMLDIYTDLTLQITTFGGHIEIIEVDELSALRKKISQKQITGRVVDFHTVFDVQPDCALDELERAAKTSVALDKLIEMYEPVSYTHLTLPTICSV